MIEEQHQGRLLRRIILGMGIPLTTVARRMGTSRSTLYKHLSQRKADDAFVQKLRGVLRHDDELFGDLSSCEVMQGELREEAYGTTFSERLWEEHLNLLRMHRRVLLFFMKVVARSNDKALKSDFGKLLASIKRDR